MKSVILLATGALILSAGALADLPSRVEVTRDVPSLLEPRQLPTKPAMLIMPREEGVRLVVKFRDEMRARVDGEAIRSLTGVDVSSVATLTQRFNLRFKRAFDVDPNVLTAIEARAAINSSKEQPDLNGMMYVEADGNLQAVANALNGLQEVEFVQFHRQPVETSSVDSQIMRQMSMAAASTAMSNVSGGIPNLTLSQRYKNFVYDLNDNGFIEAEGPDGDIYTFADNEFWGGFDIGEAIRIGDKLRTMGLTRNWDNSRNGATGYTMKVGVIEHNADVSNTNPNLAHIDLRHVRVEPNQTLMPHSLTPKDHGTATLSIIGAKDHGLPGPDRFVTGDNAELGMIGMVPEAEPWFFPIVSFEQPGGRLLSAIASAISYFDRGDVLSFSIGFPPGPIIQDTAVATLFQVAADVGITCCTAAGNECTPLTVEDDYPLGLVDSLVVGAGLPINPYTDRGLHPGFPYTRLGFSNHYQTPDIPHADAPINAQAWGDLVGSCGYGDLYFDGDRTHSYSAVFGGTSAATPMIAATVASLQGLCKMFYGMPLTTPQVRGIVSGAYFCQDGICIGNELKISGTLEPPDCSPCFDICLTFVDYTQDPPEDLDDPDIIGGFPDWGGMGTSMLESGFFDGSLLHEAEIMRGTLIYGSVIALKALDNNPLIVKAQFTRPGVGAAKGPFPAPTYFFAGNLTDVAALAKLPNPRTVTSVDGFATIGTSIISGNVWGFEAFNFAANRWQFFAASVNNPVAGPDVTFQFSTLTFDGNPLSGDFVNRDTGDFMIRIWQLGLGFSNANFWSSHDWIDVIPANGDFGGGAGGP